jgi:hypothetical protein
VDESTVADVNSHMSGTGGLASLEENQVSYLECFASNSASDPKLFPGGAGKINPNDPKDLLNEGRAIHPVAAASPEDILDPQKAFGHPDQKLRVLWIE